MDYHCLNCRAANRPEARFCLECGEPLDATTLVAAPPESMDRPRWAWTGPRSYEALIGAVILVGLIALAVVNTWQYSYDRQKAAYEAGLAALQTHQWATAINKLQNAGDYADAPRRLKETMDLWAQLQRLDASAHQAERAAAWWTAVGPLRQLAALDAHYPNITDRITTAQGHIGVLIYRVAQGPTAGLWWAHADGSDPRPLPDGTRLGVTIYGISPDQHWAVYTVRPTPVETPELPRLNILDLQSGVLTTLTLPIPLNPDPQPVRFRNDGQGFWWVADGHWSYYDTATGHLTPIRGQVLAADPQYGRLVQADFGPFDSPLDWSSLLLLTDAVGAHPQRLLGLAGSVSNGQISPDGRLLLYQAHTRLLDQVSDQLWAAWLPVPNTPDARPTAAILDSVRAMPSAPSPTLTSTFLPLGLSRTPGALLSWAGGPVHQVTRTLAQDLEFDAAGLQLGPDMRVLSLHTTATGGLEAIRLLTPSGETLDWLGVITTQQAVLYRGATDGDQLSLFLAASTGSQLEKAGSPQAAQRLLTRAPDSAAWTHSTALSRDGIHLLAIGPFAAESGPAGLWAIPLDGTAPQLTVPGAVEFWTPDGWLGSP